MVRPIDAFSFSADSANPRVAAKSISSTSKDIFTSVKAVTPSTGHGGCVQLNVSCRRSHRCQLGGEPGRSYIPKRTTLSIPLMTTHTAATAVSPVAKRLPRPITSDRSASSTNAFHTAGLPMLRRNRSSVIKKAANVPR